MSIQAKNIRNVVFAGHASKGKTTLCEALLNVAGTTERMGKTADANTVLDFDSEEKKRKIRHTKSFTLNIEKYPKHTHTESCTTGIWQTMSARMYFIKCTT